MSSGAYNHDTVFDELREDDQARADMKALAEREDAIGAHARVILALVDGEVPDRSDCEAAGLDTLPEVLEGGC